MGTGIRSQSPQLTEMRSPYSINKSIHCILRRAIFDRQPRNKKYFNNPSLLIYTRLRFKSFSQLINGLSKAQSCLVLTACLVFRNVIPRPLVLSSYLKLIINSSKLVSKAYNERLREEETDKTFTFLQHHML